MKKRKQVGRKTRCTSEIQKQFCDALAKAHTIKNACVVAGISESAFYQWLAKGMNGEEPYAKFVQLLQSARARTGSLSGIDHYRQGLARESLVFGADFPEEFGPVLHRVIVKEVPQAPPPAPIITVKHVRIDENER